MPHALAVQVCDFNLARALKTDTVEPSATLNSPAWSAPERLQGKRYGKSADVFSFGVILWELITLGKLFTHDAFPWCVSRPRCFDEWQLDPHLRLSGTECKVNDTSCRALLLPSSDSYCVLVHILLV